jgi:putative transposase
MSLTEHPSAKWTIQQLREAVPSEHWYRFLIHGRHATFSTEFDKAVRNLNVGSKDSSSNPDGKCFL